MSDSLLRPAMTESKVTDEMVERALDAFCNYPCSSDDAEGMMRAALEAALAACTPAKPEGR